MMRLLLDSFFFIRFIYFIYFGKEKNRGWNRSEINELISRSIRFNMN